MIDIIKELQKNEVLVLLFEEDYQNNLLRVVKKAEAASKKICYITLTKPYYHLVKFFKQNDINVEKFAFIDGVTSTVRKADSSENCRFIPAPNALTELNLMIAKECKEYMPDLLIFDSLSSLLIYEKEPVLLRFVHTIVNELRMNNVKSIFTLLKEDYDSRAIKDISLFVDKIIKV